MTCFTVEHATKPLQLCFRGEKKVKFPHGNQIPLRLPVSCWRMNPPLTPHYRRRGELKKISLCSWKHDRKHTPEISKMRADTTLNRKELATSMLVSHISLMVGRGLRSEGRTRRRNRTSAARKRSQSASDSCCPAIGPGSSSRSVDVEASHLALVFLLTCT